MSTGLKRGGSATFLLASELTFLKIGLQSGCFILFSHSVVQLALSNTFLSLSDGCSCFFKAEECYDFGGGTCRIVLLRHLRRSYADPNHARLLVESFEFAFVM